MIKRLFAPKKEDICPNCGTSCFATDILCPKCGKNLDELFEQFPIESFKTKPPITIEKVIAKARDIAVGFFGWVIVSNLIYALLLYVQLLIYTHTQFSSNIVYPLLNIIIWLLTLTIAIVLYIKKRAWVCSGIVIAFTINITLWIIIFVSHGAVIKSMTSNMFLSLLYFMGVPLPIGFLLTLMD